MEFEVRDNRKKEWFWLDNEYLNGYAKLLGPSCTVVYLSLCRHVDNYTQQCFPRMELIAEENGIGKSTVIRAIKKLEEWNIIRVHRGKNVGGKQEVNVYTLTAKSVWKSKPSVNMTPSKPSVKNEKSRVSPQDRNNTHINKTITFKIKNTKTKELSSKEFISEEEAYRYIKLKSQDWLEFEGLLKVVKISK